MLKGVGGHGIVASACPKSADLASVSYGYRPAMDALAGRVAGQVGRSCLTTDAEAGPDGWTPFEQAVRRAVRLSGLLDTTRGAAFIQVL